MITASRFRGCCRTECVNSLIRCNSGREARKGAACRRLPGDDMRILRVAMIGMVLVTAGSVRLSGGQISAQQPLPGRQTPGTTQKPGLGNTPDDSSPLDAGRAEKQEKLRNDDRQKRLVADTDKLLAL